MSFRKIGFIGAGNMGGAIATAAVKSSLAEKVMMADVLKEKAEEVAEALNTLSEKTTVTYAANEEIAAEADLIVLAVKPQFMAEMLGGISEILKNRTDRVVFLTMAAALSMDTIRAMAGVDFPVIRIMPNTPAKIGEGVIVYSSSGTTEEEMDEFVKLLTPAGMLDAIPERLIDAAASVSGCGPAFVYMFIEALADGGVACGLPRDKAVKYAAQMVKGAAELTLESGLHCGELKDQVCSPGGTTIQGVRTLEENGFRGAVMDAAIAAYDKTMQMK